MRAVVQRVSDAILTINGEEYSSIGPGLLVLLGITNDDDIDDVEWLANKIAHLRVMPDNEGVMNRSVLDTGSDVMVVSQFTLHALTRKGNRPSYIRAAPPESAIPLYEKFKENISRILGKDVGSGQFGAMMDIRFTNTGPVTIIIDTKNKE
jgi:D-tyrosyl-tRNA(Tyr) deacylase